MLRKISEPCPQEQTELTILSDELIIKMIYFVQICLRGRTLEIKYEIPDDKVRSFTGSAKRRLQEQAQKYTLEIISEAEKVEELIRENGASTEITDNIIFQAVRRNRTEKKKNLKIVLVRVLAEILLFISRLMFLPEMFVTTDGALNMGYLVAFLLVTLIAFIVTIVTYFIGGE